MLPEVKIHTTANGTRYALFAQQEVISDEIRRNNFWNVYNLEIADIVLQEKKNKRVIDVGAGLGSFTIPLAIKYNENHIFDSFEPVPGLCAQLNANGLLNKLDNIRCHRNGIGAENNIIDHPIFDFSATNHGSFSFLPEAYSERKIPVPNQVDVYEIRKLDDYRFASVGLIKITASGMELEVIQGARETIIQNECPPLIVESWGSEWYKSRKESVHSLIKEYGYMQIINRRDYLFAFKDVELSKKVVERLDSQLPGTRVIFK